MEGVSVFISSANRASGVVEGSVRSTPLKLIFQLVPSEPFYAGSVHASATFRVCVCTWLRRTTTSPSWRVIFVKELVHVPCHAKEFVNSIERYRVYEVMYLLISLVIGDSDVF